MKLSKCKSLEFQVDAEMRPSGRKMSIDTNPLVAPKSVIRVLSQHFQDPLEAEITAERQLNVSQLSLTGHNDIKAEVPPTFSSSTSRLNPENKFSSRLREDMRLSPIPLSPISSNKRKRDFEEAPQIKRLYVRNKSSPSNINFTGLKSSSAMSEGSDTSTQNTSTSQSPMLLDSPTVKSPKNWAMPGAPLNLSAAGNDMANMKLS